MRSFSPWCRTRDRPSQQSRHLPPGWVPDRLELGGRCETDPRALSRSIGRSTRPNAGAKHTDATPAHSYPLLTRYLPTTYPLLPTTTHYTRLDASPRASPGAGTGRNPIPERSRKKRRTSRNSKPFTPLETSSRPFRVKQNRCATGAAGDRTSWLLDRICTPVGVGTAPLRDPAASWRVSRTRAVKALRVRCRIAMHFYQSTAEQRRYRVRSDASLALR